MFAIPCPTTTKCNRRSLARRTPSFLPAKLDFPTRQLRQSALPRPENLCAIILVASDISGFYVQRRNAMSLPKTEKIWHNGKFIAWDDGKIHVLSHVVNYGSGVFEGI